MERLTAKEAYCMYFDLCQCITSALNLLFRRKSATKSKGAKLGRTCKASRGNRMKKILRGFWRRETERSWWRRPPGSESNSRLPWWACVCCSLSQRPLGEGRRRPKWVTITGPMPVQSWGFINNVVSVPTCRTELRGRLATLPPNMKKKPPASYFSKALRLSSRKRRSQQAWGDLK